MMDEASKVGPATVALFEAIMKAKPHPEQGFRSCLGIMLTINDPGLALILKCSRFLQLTTGSAVRQTIVWRPRGNMSANPH